MYDSLAYINEKMLLQGLSAASWQRWRLSACGREVL